MNFGTKLRTILAIATSLMVSIILNFVIVACVTYFNNDYTPEGETGTLTARQMKELKNYEWEQAEEPEDAEVSEHDS